MDNITGELGRYRSIIAQPTRSIVHFGPRPAKIYNTSLVVRLAYLYIHNLFNILLMWDFYPLNSSPHEQG